MGLDGQAGLHLSCSQIPDDKFFRAEAHMTKDSEQNGKRSVCIICIHDQCLISCSQSPFACLLAIMVHLSNRESLWAYKDYLS